MYLDLEWWQHQNEQHARARAWTTPLRGAVVLLVARLERLPGSADIDRQAWIGFTPADCPHCLMRARREPYEPFLILNGKIVVRYRIKKGLLLKIANCRSALDSARETRECGNLGWTFFKDQECKRTRSIGPWQQFLMDRYCRNPIIRKDIANCVCSAKAWYRF
jgi:hypothetical protein